MYDWATMLKEAPYKSKAQMRLFFAKEKRGELPKGTAREWAHHTKSIKSLPEHARRKAAALADLAAQGDLGAMILVEMVKQSAQAGRNEGYGAATGSVMKANAGLLSTNNLAKPVPQGANFNPFSNMMKPQPFQQQGLMNPMAPVAPAIPVTGVTNPKQLAPGVA